MLSKKNYYRDGFLLLVFHRRFYVHYADGLAVLLFEFYFTPNLGQIFLIFIKYFFELLKRIFVDEHHDAFIQNFFCLVPKNFRRAAVPACYFPAKIGGDNANEVVLKDFFMELGKVSNKVFHVSPPGHVAGDNLESLFLAGHWREYHLGPELLAGGYLHLQSSGSALKSFIPDVMMRFTFSLLPFAKNE